ncbi:class I SAM-dependent methyltransferase [Cryptosporangium sp. NPDC051539]|uniref:class I SAM-dependent methyltransferase n=1 Tax=Cryptosporangium sp. NPDC051539 TaxID=3363962 RepID=UPI00379A074D
MEDERRAHWDGVYGSRAVTEVSWFESDPAQSLGLIAEAGTGPGDPVIDVGGGASVLADRLLAAGYADVTVLDVAAEALATSRARLGPAAERVQWLVADVLSWHPQRRYALWHDRAVFHFLTDAAARDRYRRTASEALAPGGRMVIGTFAADGPTQCSGLPTARYTPQELAAEFPRLELVDSARQEHRTPGGGLQPFTWVLLADPDPSAKI